MVKVQEYKPGQFMINTTKSEAMLIIKSLASQLYDDNCNKGRVEFGKHRKDDVEYFSIAVDQITTEFHVMGDILLDGYPPLEMFFAQKKTLEEAKKFMLEFKDQGIMGETVMWIKEVQS
jgi:hypothetical protein